MARGNSVHKKEERRGKKKRKGKSKRGGMEKRSGRKAGEGAGVDDDQEKKGGDGRQEKG